jgi:hypothetical protein
MRRHDIPPQSEEATSTWAGADQRPADCKWRRPVFGSAPGSQRVGYCARRFSEDEDRDIWTTTPEKELPRRHLLQGAGPSKIQAENLEATTAHGWMPLNSTAVPPRRVILGLQLRMERPGMTDSGRCAFSSMWDKTRQPAAVYAAAA